MFSQIGEIEEQAMNDHIDKIFKPTLPSFPFCDMNPRTSIKKHWENRDTRFHTELFIALGELGKVTEHDIFMDSNLSDYEQHVNSAMPEYWVLSLPYGLKPAIHTQGYLERYIYHDATPIPPYTTSAKSIACFISKAVEEYGLTLDEIVVSGREYHFYNNPEDEPKFQAFVREKVEANIKEHLGIDISKFDLILDHIKVLYQTGVLNHICSQMNERFPKKADGAREILFAIIRELFANRKNEQQRTMTSHTRDTVIAELNAGELGQNMVMFFNTALIYCSEEGKRFVMEKSNYVYGGYPVFPVDMTKIVERALKTLDQYINEEVSIK